ncbi:reverse transcriptase domain-containing protein [Acetobacterium malicum]|nr:reverse transcriptase domain-containing protein [Acetobacterium malicum]
MQTKDNSVFCIPAGLGMLSPMSVGIALFCERNNMELEEWKESKGCDLKNYAHFDKRVSINDRWSYISNPKKISQHSFYPFIHYKQNFNKFNKLKGKKSKERDICYSAHIDRCIYQYYSFLINEEYNKRVIQDGINNVAVAYRNELGKNNIHFAKEMFDFIKAGYCRDIIIGDFTDFFDTLNHKYLKERLCDLLKVKELKGDYYAVYKNITKYSKWELKELLSLNGLKDTVKDKRELNKKYKVISFTVFKRLKKSSCCKNTCDYGIPQGSAISAALSNVYMLEFDKKITDYIEQNNGKYMRYSDDFIIVLPHKESQEFKKHYDFIFEAIGKNPNLKLQPDKTQVYNYENGELWDQNLETGSGNEKTNPEKVSLSYLGFTFDGSEITIRDKTISKYYYRLYRKIKATVKQIESGEKVSCKKIYLKYSEKGAYVKEGRHIGNFITYVDRAKKDFGQKEPIDRGTKSHMYKIKKHLNK